MTTPELTATYNRRMAIALPWERDVLDALWLRGWIVQPIGSGQLNGVMRDLLYEYRTKDGSPTLARWIPDICAAKRVGGRVRAYLIDAKAGGTWRESGNHDVELDALRAAEAIEPAWGLPVVFAFQDWSVASARTIRAATVAELPGVAKGRTSFAIFPRTACTPFDELFGAAQ